MLPAAQDSGGDGPSKSISGGIMALRGASDNAERRAGHDEKVDRLLKLQGGFMKVDGAANFGLQDGVESFHCHGRE